MATAVWYFLLLVAFARITVKVCPVFCAVRGDGGGRSMARFLTALGGKIPMHAGGALELGCGICGSCVVSE